MELEVFFFFYYFCCCKHKFALLTTHCPNGSVHSVALIIFLMRLVFTTAYFTDSFTVSLWVLSCFFPSCFVHNFLKFLSILEIVNLNSLVGLTFSLPPGCSLPFCAVSLYTLRFWLLNGPGGPCDGSVSGKQRVAFHSLVSWGSSSGLYSLARGSPLTSCVWFCPIPAPCRA